MASGIESRPSGLETDALTTRLPTALCEPRTSCPVARNYVIPSRLCTTPFTPYRFVGLGTSFRPEEQLEGFVIWMRYAPLLLRRTATAGSDVVQSGRPIFDGFFQHLWPYIGNNTANVVFQMVKRLWLIRLDQ
ncbi:hypothetical protein TNCV_1871031 [Trichonephila clavipes]|nr:hypothetical protein TNCV_1871031 [Trichonephila clavipes]